MRAKKPAPYKRPSVDLDKVNREWRTVRADTIKVGDIVPGVGAVTEVWVYLPAANSPHLIGLVGPEINCDYAPDEDIFAFVEVK